MELSDSDYLSTDAAASGDAGHRASVDSLCAGRAIQRLRWAPVTSAPPAFQVDKDRLRRVASDKLNHNQRANSAPQSSLHRRSTPPNFARRATLIHKSRARIVQRTGLHRRAMNTRRGRTPRPHGDVTQKHQAHRATRQHSSIAEHVQPSLLMQRREAQQRCERQSIAHKGNKPTSHNFPLTFPPITPTLLQHFSKNSVSDQYARVYPLYYSQSLYLLSLFSSFLVRH